MQYDFFLGRKLEKLESETKEWSGLLTDAVSSADEGEVDGAITEGGGVETKALFFPVV